MEPFDLLGPLPDGACTVVLEASAGTGKTFTLAGLVTRYVAEGVATLDEMLLITFGRAASQELRERVRDQLVDAARALEDPSTVGDNELLAHLVTGSPDELAARRHHLRVASPASTRPPSRRPTSSASSCSAPSASRATPTPG
ncbi:UvrD-helicase domain-containing protein [Nocardioides ungokensis]|uniref:UvrD-helicase domain-containing protein n=1 Tax=Nocardioides ungokensis TaxID=1643322 RepID=UPI001FE7C102|nr:UvrD-helicase domain-containing protein [Nocardioides ungokensis]